MKRAFAVLAAFMLLPSAAVADGMMIRPYYDHYAYVGENSQLAAINYRNGIERMIISVNADIRATEEAVWIFPVPSLPEAVVIDVVDQFPYMYGSDVEKQAAYDIDRLLEGIRSTQIYPMLFSQQGYYRAFPLLESFGAVKTDTAQAAEEITVYQHLEKSGITAEVVTAKDGSALYDYLAGMGLEIEAGSIPVLDGYVGKDYTFVVSWLTPAAEDDRIYCEDGQRDSDMCYMLYNPVCGSDYNTYSNDCLACSNPKVEWYTMGACEYGWYRQPGMFISFPTDSMYFPLMPTSVYGSKIVPVTLYVIGHVTPEYSDAVSPYTRTTYYVREDMYVEGLVNFFGDMDLSRVRYTKMEIEAPSSYFAEDLTISQSAPPKASYASLVYDTLCSNYGITSIAVLLAISAAAAAVSGRVMFGDWKYAKLGLFNLFTILGVGAALAMSGTGRSGPKMRSISKDKRKLEFLALFSAVFMLLTIAAGYLLKLPLA